jgi:hypothetical protein
MAGGCEPVGGGIDPFRIRNGRLGFLEGRFYFLRAGLADLAGMFLQRFLDVVDHRLGPILGVDGLSLLAIVSRVRFGIVGHRLHLFL